MLARQSSHARCLWLELIWRLCATYWNGARAQRQLRNFQLLLMSVPTYCIRNVNCDHYQEQVTDLHRAKLGAALNGRIPIIRIFGLTAEGAYLLYRTVLNRLPITGEKCCAHIAGIFPNILIRTKVQLNAHSKQLLMKTLTNLLVQIPNLCKDPEGPIVGMLNWKGCKTFFLCVWQSTLQLVAIAHLLTPLQGLKNAMESRWWQSWQPAYLFNSI